MQKPLICIVNTGGTIASRYRPELDGWVSDATAAELVGAVPGLTDIADFEVIEHSQVNGYRIDTETVFSLAKRLRVLVLREDIAGVVVTHGTATLEETAYLLDLTVATSKPIVITGAQRRFDDSGADGPMNIFTAVKVAAEDASRDRGVMAVFDSRIFSARDVIKVHTHSLAAFGSRDSGPIGYTSRDQVIFFSRPERFLHFDVDHLKENVQLVKLVQGGNDLLVRACISGRADGIIIEGISSGHANDGPYSAICDALDAGMPVVMVPRILFGGNNVEGTQYAAPGSIHTLIQKGAIAGGYLSGQKARILLMVALAQTKDPTELRQFFARA